MQHTTNADLDGEKARSRLLKIGFLEDSAQFTPNQSCCSCYYVTQYSQPEKDLKNLLLGSFEEKHNLATVVATCTKLITNRVD